MQPDSMVKGWFLWAILAVIVMAIGAAIVINQANSSRADIEVFADVPDFTFVAHTGEPFGLDDMKGSLTVVDFIFTSCQTACPVMTSKMSELYKLYSGSDKVRFVSFSVDPDVDTLPVLREYAAKYGVTDDRWTFVRAPIAEIKKLSEQGFMLPLDSVPMGHSTRFVLVDQDGKIRGYYESENDDKLEILKEHIPELAKKIK